MIDEADKIQRLIQTGIDEGATLVTGGTGRPEHLNRGYYIRPTVFGHVTPDMTVAREEIFGPVLSIISYEDDQDAIRIANDTVYGLAAYIQSQDIAHARAVAAEMRLPAFAIGGITLENLAQVTAAGLRRVAVSGAVLQAADPALAVRQFRDQLQ